MFYRIFVLTIIALSFSIGCKKESTTEPITKDGTVIIGTQVWMTKNLDVDHYRNGDSIPEVRDSATWVNLKTGAWCYYNNSDSLGKIYGKLYNWYAVNDLRGLAPKGWHVPSDSEWTVLTNYLGGERIAGGKMKEFGMSHWQSLNIGATNSSGFSALPGGFRNQYGDYHLIVSSGGWWSSTEYDAASAWRLVLWSDGARIEWNNYGNDNGYSIRCVKDGK